jgi:hypothetical protein
MGMAIKPAPNEEALKRRMQIFAASGANIAPIFLEIFRSIRSMPLNQ